MEITYKNKKIEKVCTDIRMSEKTYGMAMTEKIQQRLDEIRASESVEIMMEYHIGRCHLLKYDRKGQYAVDLIHPYRLVFEKGDGGIIQVAHICEIVDYH